MKRKNLFTLRELKEKTVREEIINHLADQAELADFQVCKDTVKYYFTYDYNEEKPNHQIVYDAFKLYKHIISPTFEDIDNAFTKCRGKPRPVIKPKVKTEELKLHEQKLQKLFILRKSQYLDDLKKLSAKVKRMENLVNVVTQMHENDLPQFLLLLKNLLASCISILEEGAPQLLSPRRRRKNSDVGDDSNPSTPDLQEKILNLWHEIRIYQAMIYSVITKTKAAIEPQSRHSLCSDFQKLSLFKENKATQFGKKCFEDYKKKGGTSSSNWISTQKTMRTLQEFDKFWENLKLNLATIVRQDYTRLILAELKFQPQDIKNLITETQTKIDRWKIASERDRLLDQTPKELSQQKLEPLPETEINVLCGYLDHVNLWKPSSSLSFLIT